jgi:hypothetical protein
MVGLESPLLAAAVMYLVPGGALAFVITDLVRRHWVLPSDITPFFAMSVGILAVALIMGMNGVPLSVQTACTCIVSGIICGAGAVGVKSLGRSSDDAQLIRRTGLPPDAAIVDQVVLPTRAVNPDRPITTAD